MKLKNTNNLQFRLILITILAFFFLFLSAPPEAAVMPYFERTGEIAGNLEAPTSVALDAYENIYVTEPLGNSLFIFSPGGNYISRISGLSTPLSVAVDSIGRVYIGSSVTGSVEVYDTDSGFLYKLGSGDREFTKPSSIAVDSTGNIYVVDSKENEVSVYTSDGSYSFTFGGTGSGDGEFNFPTSIAIDELSGELVVTDLQVLQSSSGPYEAARVQIFDISGVFKRSFGEYGTGEGKLVKPMGVEVDAEGRIYVSDSYQHVVQVFDSVGTYVGTIYDLDNPMRIPLGIAMGSSSRLYIASMNKSRVDIYGIDAYTQMEVAPSSLSFQGQAGDINPSEQVVEVRNTGTQVLNWTAETDESWITLSGASGVTVPSAVSDISVGVELQGLSAGNYTGSIRVSADTGYTEAVQITLAVTEPDAVLSVSPLSMGFTSVNGSVPSSQSLSIQNTGGGTLNWAVSSDRSWLLTDKAAGSAPDTINVSVDISSKSAGTYTGSIVVTGEGGGAGSESVQVTLDIVIEQGTINVGTNLQEAAFIINGPESYTGSGTTWTAANAPAGTYIIVYGDIEGYITPPSESQTLQADGTITFIGEYEKEYQAIIKRNIIVGAGSGKSSQALVMVLNEDGTETGVEFIANAYTYGVNVASGDIDGDGIDEIITGAGPGRRNPAEVNVFDANGDPISGLSITAYEYKYGVYVASADFDGDGRYEVITGAGPGRRNPADVKIFVYDAAGQRLTDSGIDIRAYETLYGVRVAAGDIDGDGVPELITVPGTGKSNTGVVRVWEVDTSSGTGQWDIELANEFTVTFTDDTKGNKGKRRSRYNYSVSIASGDINGDGINEIITGAGPHRRAEDIIKVFDRNGESISEFRADISMGYGVNVASGDMNGDSVAEIITGAGPGKRNSSVVKIFDGYGIEKAQFETLQRKYGVNIALGNLGYEGSE